MLRCFWGVSGAAAPVMLQPSRGTGHPSGAAAPRPQHGQDGTGRDILRALRGRRRLGAAVALLLIRSQRWILGLRPAGLHTPWPGSTRRRLPSLPAPRTLRAVVSLLGKAAALLFGSGCPRAAQTGSSERGRAERGGGGRGGRPRRCTPGGGRGGTAESPLRSAQEANLEREAVQGGTGWPHRGVARGSSLLALPPSRSRTSSCSGTQGRRL